MRSWVAFLEQIGHVPTDVIMALSVPELFRKTDDHLDCFLWQKGADPLG